MEILDPDLWNDDGTPKKPSAEYMENLKVAQRLEAIDPTTPAKREAEQREAYMNYARIKREAKAQRAPEVGDIVHAWDGTEGACRAAMVMETSSFNHNAEIRVHIPRKPYEDWFAVHAETNREEYPEGSWHWPCGEGQ